MPTDYDYDKYSFVLVLVRSYMGPSGTTILTKGFLIFSILYIQVLPGGDWALVQPTQ